MSEPFKWSWREGAKAVMFGNSTTGKVHVRLEGADAIACHANANVPRTALLSAADFARWPSNCFCRKCMASEYWSRAQLAVRASHNSPVRQSTKTAKNA